MTVSILFFVCLAAVLATAYLHHRADQLAAHIPAASQILSQYRGGTAGIAVACILTWIFGVANGVPAIGFALVVGLMFVAMASGLAGYAFIYARGHYRLF